MEASLLARCECASAAQREMLLGFLDEETRPVVEEEVAEGERASYLALEDIESAEWLAAHAEKAFQASWPLGGYDFEEDAKATLQALIKAGAQDVYAYLWTDEGDEVILGADAQGVKCIEEFDLELIAGEEEDDDDTEAIFAYLDVVRERERGR